MAVTRNDIPIINTIIQNQTDFEVRIGEQDKIQFIFNDLKSAQEFKKALTFRIPSVSSESKNYCTLISNQVEEGIELKKSQSDKQLQYRYIVRVNNAVTYNSYAPGISKPKAKFYDDGKTTRIEFSDQKSAQAYVATLRKMGLHPYPTNSGDDIEFKRGVYCIRITNSAYSKLVVSWKYFQSLMPYQQLKQQEDGCYQVLHLFQTTILIDANKPKKSASFDKIKLICEDQTLSNQTKITLIIHTLESRKGQGFEGKIKFGFIRNSESKEFREKSFAFFREHAPNLLHENPRASGSFGYTEESSSYSNRGPQRQGSQRSFHFNPHPQRSSLPITRGITRDPSNTSAPPTTIIPSPFATTTMTNNPINNGPMNGSMPSLPQPFMASYPHTITSPQIPIFSTTGQLLYNSTPNTVAPISVDPLQTVGYPHPNDPTQTSVPPTVVLSPFATNPHPNDPTQTSAPPPVIINNPMGTVSMFANTMPMQQMTFIPGIPLFTTQGHQNWTYTVSEPSTSTNQPVNLMGHTQTFFGQGQMPQNPIPSVNMSNNFMPMMAQNTVPSLPSVSHTQGTMFNKKIGYQPPDISTHPHTQLHGNGAQGQQQSNTNNQFNPKF